jgi:hypothetical protein
MDGEASPEELAVQRTLAGSCLIDEVKCPVMRDS